MPNIEDLIGNVFGKITVIEFVGYRQEGFSKKRIFKYRCQCGKEKITTASNIKRTRSCGCWQKDRLKSIKGIPEHNSYIGMKQRCYYKKHIEYHNYGKIGIRICDFWLESFHNFYQDMGPKPSPEHSIDRIDTLGPYSPENCRWGTREEQANNKRCSKFFTMNERTMTITQWCRELNINKYTVSKRINRSGWSIERALTTQVIKSKTQALPKAR